MAGTELQRRDALVSLCFADVEATEPAFAMLRDCAKHVEQRFSFWEMIIVVPTEMVADFRPLLADIRNLRLFSIGTRPGTYRKRVIAANEAIGDVVLSASLDETRHLDIVRMIERCIDEGRTIKGARSKSGLIDRLLANVLAGLGRIAGFDLNVRDLQTMAVSRTRLNEILAHADCALALRFPPRTRNDEVGFEIADDRLAPQSLLRNLGERLGLIERLLINFAPRLLTTVSVMAGALVLLAIGYLFYAVGAWLILDKIQPGWLTLSAVLSMIAFFLGIAILGLSLGMQNLIGRLRLPGDDALVTESNSIDLFAEVAEELNVEVH